jgi:hypothetical protein
MSCHTLSIIDLLEPEVHVGIAEKQVDTVGAEQQSADHSRLQAKFAPTLTFTVQTRSEFLVGPKISSYSLIHNGVMRITDQRHLLRECSGE